MECSLTIAKHSFATTSLDGVVDRAAAIYERKGLKFTVLRRLVLEAIAERHTPVGAYTILQVLEGRYRKLSPISVYRALDSLSRLGLVNKLKTQNAYFLAESFRTRAKQPSEKRLYLICEVCKRVTEASSPGAYQLIEQLSGSALFKISVNTVEVSGVCESCSAQRASPKPAAPVRLRQRGPGTPARPQKIAAR